MKKYNELFGIIHENGMTHAKQKQETFDTSEVEPGVPINKCVPPKAFQNIYGWTVAAPP